jgi:hypothetical protein
VYRIGAVDLSKKDKSFFKLFFHINFFVSGSPGVFSKELKEYSYATLGCVGVAPRFVVWPHQQSCGYLPTYIHTKCAVP